MAHTLPPPDKNSSKKDPAHPQGLHPAHYLPYLAPRLARRSCGGLVRLWRIYWEVLTRTHNARLPRGPRLAGSRGRNTRYEPTGFVHHGRSAADATASESQSARYEIRATSHGRFTCPDSAPPGSSSPDRCRCGTDRSVSCAAPGPYRRHQSATAIHPSISPRPQSPRI